MFNKPKNDRREISLQGYKVVAIDDNGVVTTMVMENPAGQQIIIKSSDRSFGWYVSSIPTVAYEV